MTWRRLLLTTALLLGCPSRTAQAAVPDPAPAPLAPADPLPSDPVSTARDTLSGHVQVGGGPLLVAPFAWLDGATAFRDVASAGFGLGLDAGIGVSRSVVLGGYFQYASYGEADACPTCDSTSLGFGGFIRYHLIQGARFDPWASAGVGYRSLDTGNTQYSGIEWLRLSVGGDWYALSQFAFGPYVELALGTLTDRPASSNAAVYASFVTGLRLVVDLPGK